MSVSEIKIYVLSIWGRGGGGVRGTGIEDTHLLDADLDPAFHFDADPDPDPPFHFHTDPDPALNKVMRWQRDPPWIHFKPPWPHCPLPS